MMQHRTSMLPLWINRRMPEIFKPSYILPVYFIVLICHIGWIVGRGVLYFTATCVIGMSD